MALLSIHNHKINAKDKAVGQSLSHYR